VAELTEEEAEKVIKNAAILTEVVMAAVEFAKWMRDCERGRSVEVDLSRLMKATAVLERESALDMLMEMRELMGSTIQ
jgi:hypothetical protein